VKALLFLVVFLFSLGASAHAAVAVPDVDLATARLGTGMIVGIAVSVVWRLAARRRRRLVIDPR
jgi:hypothetical protein